MALDLLTPAQARRLPEAIEITFVGIKTMCDVHRDFLSDPTPTDVITFQHGEILVCPEVARQQARRFDRTPAQETLLYGIHGILHLVGYKDKTPAAFKRMSAAQEKLLQAVLKRQPGH